MRTIVEDCLEDGKMILCCGHLDSHYFLLILDSTQVLAS